MRRVIQDALAEASASYWTARAAQFEAARPRRGDYRGTATREQLVERDERCQAIAAACRARAQLTDELRPQERRIIDEEVLSG
jgi:tellurite resistance protein